METPWLEVMRGVACGSCSFYLLTRVGTCAGVLFLKRALGYVPLSFFPCAQKFAWYPRTSRPAEPKDSEPGPKARVRSQGPAVWVWDVTWSLHPFLSLAGFAVVKLQGCQALDYLFASFLYLYFKSVSSHSKYSRFETLTGLTGVRSVPETRTALRGIVAVAKRWLSSTECSTSGESWWHGSGQKLCHGRMPGERNVKADCCRNRQIEWVRVCSGRRVQSRKGVVVEMKNTVPVFFKTSCYRSAVK